MAGYAGIMLNVDVSEAMGVMNKLANVMAPNKAHELFRRTLWDTGRHIKQIAKDDIPNEYWMKTGWIGSAVGAPVMVGTDQARIPIKTARGSIGGTFAASGGAYRVQGTTVHMADGTVRQRKAHIRTRAIKAKIVKSGISVLPARMPAWQGGQPPFRRKRREHESAGSLRREPGSVQGVSGERP